jgi:hypothetical protein
MGRLAELRAVARMGLHPGRLLGHGVIELNTPFGSAAGCAPVNLSFRASRVAVRNCSVFSRETEKLTSSSRRDEVDATLGAMKAVGPALTKFYDSLSDEQKARFNSLRPAQTRPVKSSARVSPPRPRVGRKD